MRKWKLVSIKSFVVSPCYLLLLCCTVQLLHSKNSRRCCNREVKGRSHRNLLPLP